MAFITEGKTNLIYILIIAIIAAIVGVGTLAWVYVLQPEEQPAPPEITFPEPEEEPGTEQTVNTKAGENFSVSLESNPTTGYQWEADFESDYVEFLDKQFVEYPQEPDIVGMGGRETFLFQALKSGETEIKFSYSRPGEEGVAPIDEKVYTIIIE